MKINKDGVKLVDKTLGIFIFKNGVRVSISKTKFRKIMFILDEINLFRDTDFLIIHKQPEFINSKIKNSD